ncbi:MAG: hypothetical protein ACOCU7_02835 [Tangfeifania sp.]
MTNAELLEVIESWENLELTIQEIGNNPEYLPVLMDLALYSNAPKSWRAAWMADKIHDQFPHLIIPWLDRMIQALKKEIQVGKKRHFLKLISLNTIDKKYQSFLMDYCLDAFTSGSEPVSIRVHAMQALFNISECEPDFKPELLAIIQHEMEVHPSAGISSRGKKLAKKLNAQIKQMQL